MLFFVNLKVKLYYQYDELHLGLFIALILKILDLVFWIDHKTTSVVDESTLEPNKDVGEVTWVNYKDGKKV